MKKRYIVILIILAAGISLAFWKWNTWFGNQPEAPYSTPHTQDRIILSMGEDAVSTRRISWRCDSVLSSAAYVEITQVTGVDTQRIPVKGTIVNSRAGKSAFYNTEINGLVPGAEYSYRVVNSRLFSGWHTFRMPADSSFTFIYLGDIQDKKEGNTGKLFQQIGQQYPNTVFWAFGGDMIERPKDEYWNHWFSSMDSITPSIPIIAATGNHEYLKGLPKILDSRWTYSFSNPENGPENFEGRSYFINFKDLCYIVIDTDGIQGPESLYDHYHWLKNVLSSSDKKWKIVMMHHPVYSVRDGRDNFYVRWTFKPLFETYGADLVLQGHDHGYSRITTKSDNGQKQSPVYIVSSCSPKAYEIGFDERNDRLGANLNLYQYITLKGDSLFYKSYTFDNQIYDNLIIHNNKTVIDNAENIPEQLDYPFGSRKKDLKKAEAYRKKMNERIKANTQR